MFKCQQEHSICQLVPCFFKQCQNKSKPIQVFGEGGNTNSRNGHNQFSNLFDKYGSIYQGNFLWFRVRILHLFIEIYGFTEVLHEFK